MPTSTSLAEANAPIFHFHSEEPTFCCLPSSAELTYDQIKQGTPDFSKTPSDLSQAVVYSRVNFDTKLNAHRIQYWVWYRFNDFPAPIPAVGDHNGDWEHVEVIYSASPILYFLSNHSGARRKLPQEVVREPDGRVHVWVALGSHAHYESPAPSWPWPLDRIDNGGLRWDSRTAVRDIEETSFFKEDFMGDWGMGGGVYAPPSPRRPVDENKP